VSAHAAAEVNDPPSPRDEFPNKHFFGTKKSPNRFGLRRRIERRYERGVELFRVG